ncbi:hypothetical protein BDM02DRAFT_2475808 [Thelephora ganbajun]|uniref:Uncharacterized protein n=1 Tax=Thelephora ganbajun TaxID=370292 RepID=A0ACB6ZE91_THEGA|nr:hypothetical protein BDM02DRAFT_2475808 [Thelephora ganbajun]
MRNPLRPRPHLCPVIHPQYLLTSLPRTSGLRIRPRKATRIPTTCSRVPCPWNERIPQNPSAVQAQTFGIVGCNSCKMRQDKDSVTHLRLKRHGRTEQNTPFHLNPSRWYSRRRSIPQCLFNSIAEIVTFSTGLDTSAVVTRRRFPVQRN